MPLAVRLMLTRRTLAFALSRRRLIVALTIEDEVRGERHRVRLGRLALIDLALYILLFRLGPVSYRPERRWWGIRRFAGLIAAGLALGALWPLFV
jgi:hypothetical protein